MSQERFEETSLRWKAELLDKRDKVLTHVISSAGRRRLMERVRESLARHPNCERVRTHYQGADGRWRISRLLNRGDI